MHYLQGKGDPSIAPPKWCSMAYMKFPYPGREVASHRLEGNERRIRDRGGERNGCRGKVAKHLQFSGNIRGEKGGGATSAVWNLSGDRVSDMDARWYTGSSYICSTLRKDNNRKRVVLGEIKKIMFQHMRGGNILLFPPTIGCLLYYIYIHAYSILFALSLLIVFNFYNNLPITEYVVFNNYFCNCRIVIFVNCI